MIPKIIHYVWVGNTDPPNDVRSYVEGWKRLCPDYEIMEWNNDSLKEIHCDYVVQAFERQRWAFVSDYLRLYALKRHGGFYFDTDWEMTQSIDCFRDYAYVTSFECWNGVYSPINPAMIAAEPANPLISDLLQAYDEMSFLDEQGKEKLVTNTVLITRYLGQKYGLKEPWDSTRVLEFVPRHVIFPASHFCAPQKGKENWGIHHFNASWINALPPCRRRTIVSVGNLSLVRFIKNREPVDGDWIELADNEKMLLSLSLSVRRKYGILYTKA